MSEEIHEILSLDDRGISTASDAPSKLFRSILLDLRIDRMTWDRLMRDFLTNPRSGVDNTPTKRSSERSNLNRALAKDRVTWRQFRKALQVINPKSVSYELELTWKESYVFPNERPTTLKHKPMARENELAQMFRILLRDLGVSPEIWQRLVERYLDTSNRKLKDNPPDKSTVRGNLRKSLIEKLEYTWPTFSKGLGILGVQEATVTLVLEWPRKTTRHTHHFKTGIGTRE